MIDVNLISAAKSTDFCFKTMYVGMFLLFRLIVRCFQCFVRASVTLWKTVSHEPPLPLGNYCLWTPPPRRNFQWSSVGGGGYGYFLEPHNHLSFYHAFHFSDEEEQILCQLLCVKSHSIKFSKDGRQQKKESLKDVDQEIEEFFDLYSRWACKGRTNSNVELFDTQRKESGKTSPKPSVPF